ncbi:hypothetical protein J0H58_27725 [bacterium]|nr:hypothetical protein [bacterium]
MVRLASPPSPRQPVLPGMPEPDPAPPARRPQRRPCKHEKDPRNEYLRPVKGGKWQARPYCPIVRERYDLGLFDDVTAARKARDEFWAGKRPDLPRFTRQCRTADGLRYYAVVVVPKGLLRGWWGATDSGRDRETISIGPFETRELAAAAARGVLAAACGPLFAAAALALRGKSYRKVGQKLPPPPGQPSAVESTLTDQPAA